ncbi:GatB/YqeY domain-containing protein [Coemansia reversa NRRL 1564]|uniref:Altered inheritance of mitochondria protein 41 n=1 Tax=Coemansia reversa (strain ATCC 12441 / NRRL 1564) TaxID=763665 RepID=A0A2G5BEF4_COERN|nr:GatB/YqeY domain-containing protein [Coemansia reversa NRRL 1564]|eukprot:PIA17383.1 GatB/YqeY domain-containing protein [Coemansia reversa NRRL 1564]
MVLPHVYLHTSRVSLVFLRRHLTSAAGTQGEGIHARLKADLKAAMKAKDKTILPVIRGVLSDILYAEKNPTAGTAFSKDSDIDVAAVVQRAIQRRRESIQSFADGGRQDLATAEESSLKILSRYLPTQLTTEQIEARAVDIIARLGVSGIKAMGPVMREMGINPAQAPKGRVAEVVKRLLTLSRS